MLVNIRAEYDEYDVLIPLAHFAYCRSDLYGNKLIPDNAKYWDFFLEVNGMQDALSILQEGVIAQEIVVDPDKAFYWHVNPDLTVYNSVDCDAEYVILNKQQIKGIS